VLTELAPLRAALPSALVALDFDGTLAPISPHPDDARPVPGAHRLLLDLRATGAALAVVTGRGVATLLRLSGFADVPGLVVYGLHGVERWQDGRLRAPARPAGIDELRRTLPGLVARTAGDPAVWIEDKELSLVVHTRLTAEPDRLLGLLRAPVTEAVHAVGLEVRPGKEVLEIVIPGIDKGTAIRELTGDGTAALLYAGDDVGDLPAVREVNAWSGRTGRPKLVAAVDPAGAGPLAGLADVTVPDPPGLVALLRQLTELPLPGPRQNQQRNVCSIRRRPGRGRATTKEEP
jgi:trehalose 6-phosphate phosphatase